MFIIIIIFAITFSLYVYVRRKVKGRDFQAANKIRPILHGLLFVSIELFIPIVSYLVIKILYVITNNDSPLSGAGITIALMIMVPFYFPFLSWRENPRNGNSYALYLRSFRSDKGIQQRTMRSILSMIRCFYPIYAIGDPNETISLFKRAIPIYKTDYDWKNAVSEYKEKAKIIILKLDGTDGLLWELKSIMGHLSKVLFIAEDKESFEQFLIKAHQDEIDIIDNFPSISDFPSIIWSQNKTWFSIKDVDYIGEYIYAHPWQDDSVEAIMDHVVQDTRTGEYSVNRFKSFFTGNNGIKFYVRIRDRLLFLLFPFNQQFHAISNLKKNTITATVTLYLWYCAMFYFLSWLIIPYCFYDSEGISFGNSRFMFIVYVFLLSSPIFILSAVNGPKSFWLSHSYMEERTIRRRFVRNAIIGCMTITFLLGLGWYAKLQQIREKEERQELLSSRGINEVDLQRRLETVQLKKHIDSICTDAGASALLMGYIPAEEFQSGRIVNLSYKYQQVIKDSLGTKEYYPSTKDSLMPDKWYSNIAWMVIKELYHKNEK